MDIITILMIAVGFWIGSIYRAYKIYLRSITLLKLINSGKNITVRDAIEYVSEAKIEILMMNKNDEQMAVNSIVKLKHEIVNDVHYFFTVEDDKFVAQGSTLEEAAVHFSKESGKESVGFFVHATQQKMLCFVDNKCMDYIDESGV